MSGAFYQGNRFQISPDRKTLYIASFGQIASYDVSGTTPVARLESISLGNSNEQLSVSHNGKYICLPYGGGDANDGNSYSTYLLSTTDLASRYGEFNNGPYPGPLAFSPDDADAYQVSTLSSPDEQTLPLQVFSTQTFTLLETAHFPTLGALNPLIAIPSVTTDRTGSDMFVAETGLRNGGPEKIGQVVVVGTGAGTLMPPAPSVTLVAKTPSATVSSGEPAEFSLVLSAPTFSDLHVAYSIKGSAVNGTDYVLLKDTKKIKAGKTGKSIKIVPQGDLGGAPKKTVVLELQPGAGYTVGTAGKVKAKILAEP